MPHILRSAAVLALLLLAPLLHAQSLTFGEPFPLANTRYGTTFAQPIVQTNGRDFFLFWRTDANLRVTKLVDGEARAGRHVIATEVHERPAVVWTGTHFLVMTGKREVTGQLLDANAEPLGGTFRILEQAATFHAAASNGRTVLLFHPSGGPGLLHATALTTHGTPTGVSTLVLPSDFPISSVAVASNGDGYMALVPSRGAILGIAYADDGRERWRGEIYRGTQTTAPGEVSIASDGRDYLAAWQIQGRGGVQAVRIRADGTAGPTVTIEPATSNTSFGGPVGVAWSGANWAVAYSKEVGEEDGQVRVAYVHPTAARVTGFDDPGPGSLPALAAANGRVMMTWRPGTGENPTVASLLPLATQKPEPVTFAAAGQASVAAASAPSATLAVWHETVNGETRLRAGVRSADGDWAERQISSRVASGVAATDGHDFVFAARTSPHSFAVFLDATSRVTLGPVPLPIEPFSITWTGTDYLIAGRTAVVRLSRSGTVSAPMPVTDFGVDAVASNGTQIMAVLVKPEPCPILCPFPFGPLAFAPLGPDLRPLREPRLLIPGEEGWVLQVEWDGTRFLAAWSSHDAVRVIELPTDGGEARVLMTIPSSVRSLVHMAVVEGGAAVTWREQSSPFGHTRSMVAVIRHDDSISTAAFDDGGQVHEQTFVAALPNGALGFLTSNPQYAPPHHGSSRVVMRVAGAALPPKPEPPRLTGEVRNGRVELAWTAPPREVSGYRLEYRIGDGAWNEFDRWFSAAENEITVLWQLRKGVPYQFRIRAFSDAGTSGYSAPVFLNLPKRRSVR